MSETETLNDIFHRFFDETPNHRAASENGPEWSRNRNAVDCSTQVSSVILQTSNTFPCLSYQHVCTFLTKMLSGLGDPDVRMLSLSCAIQVFEHVGRVKDSLSLTDVENLKDLFDKIIGFWKCHTVENCDHQNAFLSQNAVSAGLLVFPEKAGLLLANQSIPLGTQLEVVTAVLTNYPEILIDYNPEKLLIELLQQVDYDEIVIIRFLFTLLENKQGETRFRSVCASHWDLMEPLLNQFLVSSDALVVVGVLRIIDNLFDYSGELFLLSKSDVPAFYCRLSWWVFENLDKLSGALALESARFVSNFGSNSPCQSCTCREKHKIVSLMIKACCVLMRTLTTGNHEVYAKFLQTLCGLRYLCSEHSDASFAPFLCTVFSQDDEELCIGMLCALHLYLIVPKETNSRLSWRVSTPFEGFDAILDLISDDHYVLVSWITDNQNCFLVYFLQYLKNVEVVKLSERQRSVLTKLRMTIDRLNVDGKIAFNPTPLLRKLDNVLHGE